MSKSLYEDAGEFIAKFTSNKIFSDIRKEDITFQGKNRQYSAKYQIKNRALKNLFYYCLDGDSVEYSLNIFTFESEKSRDELVALLETVQKLAIPQLLKIEEFFVQDDDNYRYKFALVERCQASLSVHKLIKLSDTNKLLKSKIEADTFIYNIIIYYWATVFSLRENGMFNTGLNSQLVYLGACPELYEKTNSSKIQRIDALFNNLNIVVDYKNVSFKRILIKELTGHISISELEKLKYCDRSFIKSAGDKIFDDYINFALLIIQLKTHYKYLHEILPDIDFAKGDVDIKQLEKIDDNLLIEWIKICLDPTDIRHDGFFTLANPELAYLREVRTGQFQLQSFPDSLFSKRQITLATQLPLKMDFTDICLKIPIKNFPQDSVPDISNKFFDSKCLKTFIDRLKKIDKNSIRIIEVGQHFISTYLNEKDSHNKFKTVSKLETCNYIQFMLIVANFLCNSSKVKNSLILDFLLASFRVTYNGTLTYFELLKRTVFPEFLEQILIRNQPYIHQYLDYVPLILDINYLQYPTDLMSGSEKIKIIRKLSLLLDIDDYSDALNIIVQTLSTKEGALQENIKDEAKLALFSLAYLPNLIRISSLLSICLKNLIKEIVKENTTFQGFEFQYKYSFICISCRSKKVCLVCASHCHKTHDVIANGISSFQCECSLDSCGLVTMPDSILINPKINSKIKASYNFLKGKSISIEDDNSRFIFNNNSTTVENLILYEPLFCSSAYDAKSKEDMIHCTMEIVVLSGGLFDDITIGLSDKLGSPPNIRVGTFGNSLGYHAETGFVKKNKQIVAKLPKFGSGDRIRLWTTTKGRVYIFLNDIFVFKEDLSIFGESNVYAVLSFRGNLVRVCVDMSQIARRKPFKMLDNDLIIPKPEPLLLRLSIINPTIYNLSNILKITEDDIPILKQIPEDQINYKNYLTTKLQETQKVTSQSLNNKKNKNKKSVQ